MLFECLFFNEIKNYVMKSKLYTLAGIALILCVSIKGFAQTSGTLTFTYNQPQPTNPPPNAGIKNVLAVWIENSTGAFVKTKYRFVSGQTQDHLPTWSVKSGGALSNAMGANCNITDATSGATCTSSTTTSGVTPAGAIRPTAYGTKTVVWDGKGVVGSTNGAIVADGVYKVWVESSWVDSGSNNHGTIDSFSFTKGPTAQHLTPTPTVTYFNTVVLDWVPDPLGIADNVSQNTQVVIYPNPTQGIFNIEFKNEIKSIKIANVLGQVVYDEKETVTAAGTTKSINLSNFENGTYIVNVSNDEGTSSYKLILDK